MEIKKEVLTREDAPQYIHVFKEEPYRENEVEVCTGLREDAQKITRFLLADLGLISKGRDGTT